MDDYEFGPDAYGVWADLLETGTADAFPYHGNSYVGHCTQEGKYIAAEFLGRLSKSHAGKLQAEHLMQASKAYLGAAAFLKQFIELFPFAMIGKIIKDKRKEGSEILLAVEKQEREGIKHLKAALKVWE